MLMILSVTPLMFISSPAMKKKGMASMVNEFAPLTMRWAIMASEVPDISM